MKVSRPESFASYLMEYKRSFWIYLIILVSMLEILVASYSSVLGAVTPFSGVLMLGFIPGYASQRAVFPRREISTLERVLLSIFLSIVISISLGTVLGYVHIFRADTNAIALAFYSVMATMVAGYRAFQSL